MELSISEDDSQATATLQFFVAESARRPTRRRGRVARGPGALRLRGLSGGTLLTAAQQQQMSFGGPAVAAGSAALVSASVPPVCHNPPTGADAANGAPVGTGAEASAGPPVPVVYVGRVYAAIPAGRTTLPPNALWMARELGLALPGAGAVAAATGLAALEEGPPPGSEWEMVARFADVAEPVGGRRAILVERGVAEQLARGKVRIQEVPAPSGDGASSDAGGGAGGGPLAPLRAWVGGLRRWRQLSDEVRRSAPSLRGTGASSSASSASGGGGSSGSSGSGAPASTPVSGAASKERSSSGDAAASPGSIISHQYSAASTDGAASPSASSAAVAGSAAAPSVAPSADTARAASPSPSPAADGASSTATSTAPFTDATPAPAYAVEQRSPLSQMGLGSGGGGSGNSPPRLAIVPLRMAMSILHALPHRFLFLTDRPPSAAAAGADAGAVEPEPPPAGGGKSPSSSDAAASAAAAGGAAEPPAAGEAGGGKGSAAGTGANKAKGGGSKQLRGADTAAAVECYTVTPTGQPVEFIPAFLSHAQLAAFWRRVQVVSGTALLAHRRIERAMMCARLERAAAMVAGADGGRRPGGGNGVGVSGGGDDDSDNEGFSEVPEVQELIRELGQSLGPAAAMLGTESAGPPRREAGVFVGAERAPLSPMLRATVRRLAPPPRHACTPLSAPKHRGLARAAAVFACGALTVGARGLAWTGNLTDRLLMNLPFGPRLLGVPAEPHIQSHGLQQFIGELAEFNKQQAESVPAAAAGPDAVLALPAPASGGAAAAAAPRTTESPSAARSAGAGTAAPGGAGAAGAAPPGAAPVASPDEYARALAATGVCIAIGAKLLMDEEQLMQEVMLSQMLGQLEYNGFSYDASSPTKPRPAPHRSGMFPATEAGGPAARQLLKSSTLECYCNMAPDNEELTGQRGAAQLWALGRQPLGRGVLLLGDLDLQHKRRGGGGGLLVAVDDGRKLLVGGSAASWLGASSSPAVSDAEQCGALSSPGGVYVKPCALLSAAAFAQRCLAMPVVLEGSAAWLAEGRRLRVPVSALDSMAMVAARIEDLLRVPTRHWMLVCKRYQDDGASLQLFSITGGEFLPHLGLLDGPGADEDGASAQLHLIPAIRHDMIAFNDALGKEIEALEAAGPPPYFERLPELAQAAGKKELPEGAAGWSAAAESAFKLLPLSTKAHETGAQEAWRAYCQWRAKGQLSSVEGAEEARAETGQARPVPVHPPHPAPTLPYLALRFSRPEEEEVLRHSVVPHEASIEWGYGGDPESVNITSRIYAVDGNAAVDVRLQYHRRERLNSIEFKVALQYALVKARAWDVWLVASVASPDSGWDLRRPNRPWHRLFTNLLRDTRTREFV
eukprot:scaffold5.g953.t1